jgi:8-oxo-dGTP pyrophosphatase MutT (NUDIX family)
MNQHVDQPIRPAATVIIVRDASPQYEIFMLRRTNQAAFAGGMYVFPGGRVDDEDHSQIYNDCHSGPDSHQTNQREALGKDWQAYWIAGIRETFEESGLMLAYDDSNSILSYDDDSWTRFQDYREQLYGGSISLADICQKEKLNLAIDLIHFYNRWITPEGRPRRFDTRFFITEAPQQQTGEHDGTETVDSLWISPSRALELHSKDEFGMMAVTAKQLTAFSEFKTAEDFTQMARNNQDFPTYRPTIPSKA